MAIYSGRRISATGTYRRFPIVGTALIATALFLLSHIGVDTPFWESAIYMALLGAGLGLTMQVLLIAAQNSVAYSELGVGDLAGDLLALDRRLDRRRGVRHDLQQPAGGQPAEARPGSGAARSCTAPSRRPPTRPR